jgi:aspartyl aminopeptidase
LGRFIDVCPTPYHAVREVTRRLLGAGFVALDEREPWALEPGRRVVLARGGSVLAAIVGQRSPASAGFRIIGAHTDSPNLKLKPRAAFSKAGYRQIGVETYGGVLWTTWLDRDLSVAGRLAVRGPDGVRTVLVDLGEVALRIPNLAIHLNRQVNEEGLKLNAQQHLPPLWGLEAEVAEDALLTRIAARAEVDPKDVLDHDLSLYDTQRAAIAGGAFIHSARLDNLASCFSALEALLETTEDRCTATRVVVLNDHEEVGSQSQAGAQGPFLRAALERLLAAHPEQEAQAFPRAMAASLLVSVDMAHAVHPNYADRHEPQHQPVLGKGPVIKVNANQRYATDGESAAIFASYCREAGFTPQSFVTRTDLPCGTTIGPITAALLGVRTVDVGNPMLSMHSCREMAGVADVPSMQRALAAHLRG